MCAFKLYSVCWSKHICFHFHFRSHFKCEDTRYICIFCVSDNRYYSHPIITFILSIIFNLLNHLHTIQIEKKKPSTNLLFLVNLHLSARTHTHTLFLHQFWEFYLILDYNVTYDDDFSYGWLDITQKTKNDEHHRLYWLCAIRLV